MESPGPQQFTDLFDRVVRWARKRGPLPLYAGYLWWAWKPEAQPMLAWVAKFVGSPILLMLAIQLTDGAWKAIFARYGRLPRLAQVMTASLAVPLVALYLFFANISLPDEPVTLRIRSVSATDDGARITPNLVLPEEHDGLTIFVDEESSTGETSGADESYESVALEVAPEVTPQIPPPIDPSTVRIVSTPEEAADAGPPPGSLGLLGVGR